MRARTSSVEPKKAGVGEGGGRKRAPLLVELSLLLTVLFFGGNFVAVKLVVEAVPPLLFAAARFTAVGLLLLVLLRLVEPERRVGRGELLPLVGLGLVGITLNQSAFTIGVSLTTAASTALVYSTAPIWGMLLGAALGLERPRLLGLVGVALAFAGVGLVVRGGLGEPGASLAGDLLVLVAGACWGSYTVLSLPLLRRHSPLAVAAYSILFGGLAIVPFSLFDLGVEGAGLTATVWIAALFSTLCSGVFGFAAWQKGVSSVGANRVLVYQYLVTLVGVSAGLLLLGESFGLGQVVGAAILLFGVYLARRG
jgi:drug/metabolite transporter (DMT)-like permease